MPVSLFFCSFLLLRVGSFIRNIVFRQVRDQLLRPDHLMPLRLRSPRPVRYATQVHTAQSYRHGIHPQCELFYRAAHTPIYLQTSRARIQLSACHRQITAWTPL
jgi:hypothetical protein